MPVTPRRHYEWLWLAALVLLVSLHFDWLPKLGRGQRHDSYSAYEEGKKACYLLARSRGMTVSRNLRRLSALVDSMSDSDYEYHTLCLLGPTRYPNDAEWERILEWVADGGSLLVAARSGTGGEPVEFEIPGFGVSVKKNTGPFESVDIKTPTMSAGKFIWQSNGEIDTAETSDLEILVQNDQTTQAVGLPHGNGYVVVVASDFVFSNQSLAWSDYSNAELAIRLLESAGSGGHVHLDESLNSSGTPKVVGLMFEPFMWPVTVQLFVGLLLFAWWGNRRFGGLLPRSVAARHNIVDHTDTLGMLYFKSNSGSAALNSYLKQLEHDLRISNVAGAEDRALAPIAARLGKSVEAVRKVFDRARKYADSGHLDRKGAAKIIHRLALIRDAMAQPAKTGRAGNPTTSVGR